jgi:CubicO group peptidase (beta-lactamase class C family)
VAGSRFPSARARAALDLSGAIGIVRYDLSEAEYVRAFEQFSVAGGYRLTEVRGYEVGGRARYAAIWEQSGLRPLRLTAYVVGASTRFAGIWELTGGPERVIHWDVPAADLHAHAEQARGRGYRIIDLCGYAPATWGYRESLIASVWEAGDGPGWTVTGPVDAQGHQRDFDRLAGAGWRPVRTNGWYAGRNGAGGSRDGTRFAALWEAPEPGRDSPPDLAARHGIDSEGLARALDAEDADGLRLEQLGAYSLGSGSGAAARFCPVWTGRDASRVVPSLVAAFARDYEVPAVAVAVARRGKLVFAHGYGESISPYRSLFRIASISKPITSAAVMQLAEKGSLTLDDPVFGAGGHLAGMLTGPPADSRVTAITVRHLLRHACGGWPGDADDPMFTLPELPAAELVDTVVRTRPLDHDPGTHYAYSNFGYCVLGRLIENITGTSYEQHVGSTLLAACGITDMCLAGDGAHDRRPFEVTYRGHPDPYGLPVRRMDSHGGWLASAVDLLRFAVRVDGFDAVPDVLAPRWVAEMAAVPDLAGSEGYGAGWGIHADGTRSHLGRLPGTSTALTLTPDGLCISLLTNTNSACEPPDPRSDTIAGLSRLTGAIRERVDFWPTGTAL